MAWVDGALRDAVARVAATELDPTDPFRGFYVSDQSAVAIAEDLDGGGAEARLAALARRAGITGERDVAILALVAAPDLDARYGRLIGYLHDDLTRGRASPRLIARLLDAGDVLARLALDAPLRAGGLVRMLPADEQLPVADRPLALDPLAVAVLHGAALTAVPPGDGLRIVAPPALPPGRPALVAALRERLEAAGTAGPPGDAAAAARGGRAAAASPVPLALVGDDAEALIAEAAGGEVVVLDAARAAAPEALAQARLLAALRGAPLAIGLAGDDDRRHALPAGVALLLAARARDLDAVRGVALQVVEVPPPTPDERRAAWAAAVPGADLGRLAERFAFPIAEIGRIAASAATPDEPAVLDAARVAARRAVGRLATRLDGGATWDDLVLPPEELQALRGIAHFVTHRDVVVHQWGFGALRGAPHGLTALFSGLSGTGKTLAARVLGDELGVEAYRIDLSAIVSKYIGETEKHLDEIFAAAARVNALLVFDEADAIFGRRSAVTDARDRYANLEVAFLLQRLETHDGVSILTTNLRQNLDPAFLRRFDHAIEFPAPGPEQRAELWRRHLPPAAPLAADVDPVRLARHDLTGGSIATCTRVAAFAAAAEGAIRMAHLEEAVRLEMRKLGRLPAG
jgi:hypothetical protein